MSAAARDFCMVYAARKGWIIGNPAREARPARVSGRHRERVEIPTKEELRRIIVSAEVLDAIGVTPFAYPMIHLDLFTGLRISEERALARPQLDLGVKVDVVRRADERGLIGPPKSAAGRRSVPIGPATTRVLKAWLAAQLAADRPNPDRLLFPTCTGKVESYANILHRMWIPVLTFAGVTAFQVSWQGAGRARRHRRYDTLKAAQSERDRLRALDLTATGCGNTDHRPAAPVLSEVAKYGFHALRHAAASIWIEQGLTPKQVQARMGHESLQMTMDLYGHLWPDTAADRRTAAASERVILG
jgi:integrase